MLTHQFHIPVMGIGYTLDTPIKVAKYGISSVISLVQDDVIEKARMFYSRVNQIPYTEIKKSEPDYRSRRITAYLNLTKVLVDKGFKEVFKSKTELNKYARLLPGYVRSQDILDKKNQLKPGSIDVNIMTKLDRQGIHGETDLSEACSALKGFAKSQIDGSLVLSAGINPKLFAYITEFEDFFPDKSGYIKKRIILKVSDYRSALIQGKMLAKRGIWVSEYRVESGLNCGGHAFPTEGILLGPILQDFKQNRKKMNNELLSLCHEAWKAQNKNTPVLIQKLTVQGGIGTAEERELLESFYNVNGTGWGSPFLLVPEATSIDNSTLDELIAAGEDDIYTSDISPLGVKFNTIKNNNAEKVRLQRIAQGKPGSPCIKKHVALDKRYSDDGICPASVNFQKKRIEEINSMDLTPNEYLEQFNKITEKECICDGLANSFLKKFNLDSKDNNDSISVCPGPNLAYFDKTYSLERMVGHIYGKSNILTMRRPHMFLKEMSLYVNHLKEITPKYSAELSVKELKKLETFQSNLLNSIAHYLINAEAMWLDKNTVKEIKKFRTEVENIEMNELV
ncbi:hypothetical protein [Reichenbachiella versicolor]|uniref:hypothetical protein n=1 Tax=Reichenbachiella versicolor TaxID=1821036 RepID=UPI000D6E54BB|nr:hypothetical protein [Reichenbachiella versicolor]